MPTEVASRFAEGTKIQTTNPRAFESFHRIPLQEEELMAFRRTEQVLPYVLAQAQKRFPFHYKKIMGALDVGITQFDGHEPRRDGTEASIHQVRTVYRALLYDPDLTPIQAAIYGNHDTIEDCNLTQKDFADLLAMREEDERFLPEEISRVAFGVYMSSRKRNNEELSQTVYMGGLEDSHWADSDLGVITGKTWDGIDNGENDKSVLIDNPTSIDPWRVLEFTNGKLKDVLKLARLYVPRAVGTQMLAETMRTCKELALREIEIRESKIRETEQHEAEMRHDRKTRLRRAIARVPA